MHFLGRLLVCFLLCFIHQGQIFPLFQKLFLPPAFLFQSTIINKMSSLLLCWYAIEVIVEVFNFCPLCLCGCILILHHCNVVLHWVWVEIIQTCLTSIWAPVWIHLYVWPVHFFFDLRICKKRSAASLEWTTAVCLSLLIFRLFILSLDISDLTRLTLWF